jgi:hypothetical protein
VRPYQRPNRVGASITGTKQRESDRVAEKYLRLVTFISPEKDEDHNLSDS